MPARLLVRKRNGSATLTGGRAWESAKRWSHADVASAFEKLLGLNCPEAADVLNGIIERDALDGGHQQGSKVGGTVHAGHAVNINGAACGQSIKDTGANVVPSLPTAGRVGQSDVVVARPRVHVGTLFLKCLSETRDDHLHTVLAEKVGIFRLGKAPQQNNGLAP